jgi:hypothetical protein
MNVPALPAYLQNRKSQRVAEGAAEGIGGALPPHISIRGNEFTLVDAAGNKAEVPDKYLDVCFVDRSEVVCKLYYENEYEPGANDPPTCWSANGVAPSVEASQPQSATCATCQWNVRGSDVSKLSGKAIKACRDEKWTAVIAVKYPAMIFQFRVTPGSFKAWKGYTDKFKGQQTDLSDVVTRIAFEKQKNGVLTFEAVSYIDQPLYEARERAAVEKKTDILVGRNDRPIQAVIAARSAQEPNCQTPTHDSIGGIGGPLPDQAPTGRRKRRTKAEIEADQAKMTPATGFPTNVQPAGSFGGQTAGPAPFRPVDPPANAGQAAPFGIATTAVAPDPAMKGMLDGIFGKSTV